MSSASSELPGYPAASWWDVWCQLSWGVLLFVVCAVVIYSAWYYLLVVDKPRLVGGGTSLRKHVITHCPILYHYYYPTFWAPNRHFTTIGRAKLQKCPGVTYRRYELYLAHKAQDWHCMCMFMCMIHPYTIEGY